MVLQGRKVSVSESLGWRGARGGASKSKEGRVRLQGAVAELRCAKEPCICLLGPPLPPPQDPLFRETLAAFLPKREKLFKYNRQRREGSIKWERARMEERKKKEL